MLKLPHLLVLKEFFTSFLVHYCAISQSKMEAAAARPTLAAPLTATPHQGRLGHESEGSPTNQVGQGLIYIQ